MADLNTFKTNYTISQFERFVNFVTNKIADQYDSSISYIIDDYAIYEGRLYQCIEATTGTFDNTKWLEQKLFDNDGYIILKG